MFKKKNVLFFKFLFFESMTECSDFLNPLLKILKMYFNIYHTRFLKNNCLKFYLRLKVLKNNFVKIHDWRSLKILFLIRNWSSLNIKLFFFFKFWTEVPWKYIFLIFLILIFSKPYFFNPRLRLWMSLFLIKD